MMKLSDMPCSSKLFLVVGQRSDWEDRGCSNSGPQGDHPGGLVGYLAHRRRRTWTAVSKKTFPLFTTA